VICAWEDCGVAEFTWTNAITGGGGGVEVVVALAVFEYGLALFKASVARTR
jgi:hypothetical protein